MANRNGQSGCGCCGIKSGLGCVLLLVLLGAAAFLGFRLFNNLKILTSSSGWQLPSSEVTEEGYISARQRLGHFLSTRDSNSVTLSASDVNSLLADAPELWFLHKRAVATLHDDVIELHLSVPLILSGTKYFNYVIFMRPTMRGENVALNVFRIDRDGRTLDGGALRAFKTAAEPYLDKALSGINMIQGDRAIRDIRIGHDSLELAR
ncbi:MAG: hypothetical protein WB586_23470 [Chthoniobacterales bacterium]